MERFYLIMILTTHPRRCSEECYGNAISEVHEKKCIKIRGKRGSSRLSHLDVVPFIASLSRLYRGHVIAGLRESPVA